MGKLSRSTVETVKSRVKHRRQAEVRTLTGVDALLAAATPANFSSSSTLLQRCQHAFHPRRRLARESRLLASSNAVRVHNPRAREPIYLEYPLYKVHRGNDGQRDHTPLPQKWLDEPGILVDIQCDHLRIPAVLYHVLDLLHVRQFHDARAAPGCPYVHDGGLAF